MKKALKIVGILLLIIIIAVISIASYIKIALPKVAAATDLKITPTPEKIQRGEYLANHVMVCMDCHSTRNMNEYSAPLVQGTLGKGGEKFDPSLGFPGTYYAANITPSGIGKLTDGEIFRAITTGVAHDGHAMFPIMPYKSYAKLDRNDIEAIIAYIRTLAPIENTVPAAQSDFPMNIIINTIPEEADLTRAPSEEDSLAYGQYLFTAAACHDCHTPFEKGKFDETRFMSGGRVFELANGTLTSANITPDTETGIGFWSKDAFINKFKTYRDSTGMHQPLKEKYKQTIMPWTMYAGMTDKDLGAIYTYLQTIPPIKNPVIKFKSKN